MSDAGFSADCPKCGFDGETQVRYMSLDLVCDLPGPARGEAGEHLHVTCARCGFTESRLTLDAKP